MKTLTLNWRSDKKSLATGYSPFKFAQPAQG